MSDPNGNWPKWVSNIGNAVKKAVSTVANKVKSVVSSVKKTAKVLLSSLPRKGEPGSSQTLHNPDGTPKQKRWYGPDGNAERDRDYNHPGDMSFPHDHVWENGKRGKDHLDPSPDYEFSFEPVIGVAIVTASTMGIALIVADDATGLGIGDNVLLGPLGNGIREGLIRIFK